MEKILAWQIKIKTSAKHEIKKFDKSIQTQVFEFLNQLAASKDPRQHLLPYTGPLAGYWKKRIGDYRLVMEIQDKIITIEVFKAGHRSKVYK